MATYLEYLLLRSNEVEIEIFEVEIFEVEILEVEIFEVEIFEVENVHNSVQIINYQVHRTHFPRNIFCLENWDPQPPKMCSN